MHKKISTSLVASFLLATNLFSAQELESITVTSATKTSQSIKDVTSNIDVITSEEIEARRFTTVVEALNTIPGVSFTSNGGLGQTTSVFVRGFSSSRVLVLIDGIRYNDVTSTSGAPFEHLMISEIEQIEVIKGSQSGIWGADASAGVINIVTKSAKEGTFGDVKVEYGTFNTQKYNMNLSHKNKDFYVKGNFSKLTSDGFSINEPSHGSADYGKRAKKLGFEKDSYDNLTASLKAGYYINDENKIDLTHTLINADTDYDGYGFDAENIAKTRDTFSSVSYQNKNSFATTDIYANKSVFDREYTEPSGWTPKTFYKGGVNEYGAKTNIPYFNDDSFVLLGADYKTFEHKNDMDKKYNNKSIFATNSNKFFDNTIFTQSLRTDNYDKFDNKTTGKIGLKHFITDDLEVSTNYGTGYNAPNLTHMYGAWGANPNLKPEDTKSKDVGFAYKGFSATYFHNKIEDMIDWQGAGYVNIEGTSRLKGYELAYKKDVIEDIFLNLSYTKLSAKDDKENFLVSRVKDSVKFGVDYYGISKLHLNMNGEYVGDRTDYSTAQTGNYTLWNTVLNYDINKTFSTYLKVDNIFNKYYQVIDGYATAERSAYIGLKASF